MVTIANNFLGSCILCESIEEVIRRQVSYIAGKIYSLESCVTKLFVSLSIRDLGA
jgi:hypothetical protein